jgi:hypothetical protein
VTPFRLKLWRGQDKPTVFRLGRPIEILSVKDEGSCRIVDVEAESVEEAQRIGLEKFGVTAGNAGKSPGVSPSAQKRWFDSRRLDWIEQKDARLYRVPAHVPDGVESLAWQVWFDGGPDGSQSIAEGVTLREAIDNAMKLTGDLA